MIAEPDPLGGSPFVESLTDEIEAEARDQIAHVDKEYGGMVGAVRAGYVQREIHREAVRYQREVESGDRVVVGVNEYRIENEERPEVFRPDPGARDEILESLGEEDHFNLVTSDVETRWAFERSAPADSARSSSASS